MMVEVTGQVGPLDGRCSAKRLAGVLTEFPPDAAIRIAESGNIVTPKWTVVGTWEEER